MRVTSAARQLAEQGKPTWNLGFAMGFFVTSKETEATTRRTTTRAAHAKHMSSNTGRVETRAAKKHRERDANAVEAIPGLPEDIVVTDILRSGYFDDPADLARLRVVSPAMRDAVVATGLKIEEIKDIIARKIVCVSALLRLQRRGLLSDERSYARQRRSVESWRS